MNEYLKRNYQGSSNKAEIERFRRCLPYAMKLLPSQHRQIIQMRFLEDMDGKQIAEKLSISKQRVSKVLNTAIPKLEEYSIVLLQFHYNFKKVNK